MDDGLKTPNKEEKK
jgi:glucan-binding YG repeat protein